MFLSQMSCCTRPSPQPSRHHRLPHFLPSLTLSPLSETRHPPTPFHPPAPDQSLPLLHILQGTAYPHRRLYRRRWVRSRRSGSMVPRDHTPTTSKIRKRRMTGPTTAGMDHHLASLYPPMPRLSRNANAHPGLLPDPPPEHRPPSRLSAIMISSLLIPPQTI